MPIALGPNLVTPRGLRLIAATLAALDRAIDGERDPAALTALKRDHRYWSTRQSTARVADPPGDDAVAIGSRVTFRLGARTRTIDIVGGDEADGRDRIAFSAPLARAMIGAAPGETVEFAGRGDTIEIVETAAAPDDR